MVVQTRLAGIDMVESKLIRSDWADEFSSWTYGLLVQEITGESSNMLLYIIC